MRKLLWFTMGFGAACAFCAYVYRDIWVIPAAAILLFLAVGCWLASKYVKPFRLLGMVLLGVAVGLAWFAVFHDAYVSLAAQGTGESEFAVIEVTDYSWEGTYGATLDGKVTRNGRTFQVRAYLRDQQTLLPGDVISGEFRFRVTTGDAEEDATYHQGKGIFLLAYQTGDISVNESETLPLKYYPAYLRMRILSLIDTSFPEDAAPFAKALLLGDSTDIDYSLNTAFKVTGIRHIIAVSGLHVSILFAAVYTLAGKKRYLTAIVGIPVVFLFAAVAGFSPSVTRACIMQCLMMLSLLWKREYDPSTALSFASLAMLMINPLVITSVSFQLSVGSMAGIFLFSQPVKNWLMDEKRLGRWKGRGLKTRLANWFSSGVAVSLSAGVLTTPLVALYFSTVSLISVVTNLLTLWVVSIIFYGIILVCLLGLFWTGGATLAASLVAWPIRYVLKVTTLLSKLPFAAVYTYSDYIVCWLVCIYVLLVLFALAKRKRPGLFACLAALGLCAALLASWLPWLGDTCSVTVLDVGQGQSILLQSEGKTFLVDCGGDYGDTAADIAAETLLSRGISHIDGLILTHFDKDHAGGAEYLLTRIQVDSLIVPAFPDTSGVMDALESAFGEKVFPLITPLSITYGASSLTVIPPAQAQTDNESSLCVLFQTENCAILITGDRDESGELELLRTAALPDIDLLIVGHHGSKYATTEALLSALTPETAVISVGENNHYGHPAEETLNRLLEAGCAIYRTDRDGTVIYWG